MPHAAGGDATGDMFMNIEGIRGSMFDDMLVGDMYDNTLYGNQGTDKLMGIGG
jgi:hypothetical protein